MEILLSTYTVRIYARSDDESPRQTNMQIDQCKLCLFSNAKIKEYVDLSTPNDRDVMDRDGLMSLIFDLEPGDLVICARVNVIGPDDIFDSVYSILLERGCLFAVPEVILPFLTKSIKKAVTPKMKPGVNRTTRGFYQCRTKVRYGYMIENGQVVKNPSEQHILDTVRDLKRDYPEMTVHEIITYLHKKDLRSRNGEWTWPSLYHIMKLNGIQTKLSLPSNSNT